MTPSPPPLVGRETELRTLTEMLAAPDGLPAVVVLHGEAGIGKTALWLRGVEHAAAHGYRVLSSRPAEAEASMSYAGLADLLAGVTDEVLPELPPIQRRALEGALLLGESEVEAGERAVAAAFLASLKVLASTSPLCVAIDDVQWLDEASAAALRFALSRLRDEPIALFAASRGDVPQWVRRSMQGESVVAVEVGTLSIGATQELLSTRLGASFPRPTLIRVWETSGGNPFFALELGGALQRRGGTLASGENLPIPSELDELLRARVDELGTAAVEVARAVALLAEPTVGLVETAVGSEAERGLTEALEARIVELDGDRVRFTHPLLGSAVVARQAPSRRRLLHARLATIAPTMEERALHLAVATVEPDGEVAAVLDEAARKLHARGASAAAADLAEHAHRLTPATDAADAFRRVLEAADRHHQAGDSERAIALLEQARAESEPGVDRAAVLLHLAEVRSDVGGPGEGVAAFSEALDEARGHPALEAESLLGIAMVGRIVEGVDRSLPHAESAVRAAALASDPRLECRALASFGLLWFNAGYGIPQAEMRRALELEDALPSPKHALATMAAYHQLGWSVELDEARRHAGALLADLEARDDPAQSDPLFHLALIEWRAGNWVAASRYAERAVDVVQQSGHDGMVATTMYPKGLIDAHRGRVDDARRSAEWAIADSAKRDAVVTSAGHRGVLGFVELSQGRSAEALEQLRPVAEMRDTFGLREPCMRLELGDLLEALVTTGALDEAEQILAIWQQRALTLDRTWLLAILARCRGLLFASSGDLDGALESFATALAEHARTTDPFQHARTLLALGRTQRRAKKRGDARRTLDDALARFETLGAPLWAEQTRAELARIGGRAPSRGELTEAERRIALLVADGRRNREVAAELFLTEHSVETALSRIYRKLGIRSRGELGRALSNS